MLIFALECWVFCLIEYTEEKCVSGSSSNNIHQSSVLAI